MSIWDREPVAVIATAAVGVVNTGIGLGTAFGLAITSGQAAAIGAFVTAVIVFAAIFARSQVVPVNASDGPTRLMKARAQKEMKAAAGGAAARSPYREPGFVAIAARRSRLEPLFGVLTTMAVMAFSALLVTSLFAVAGCTPAEIQVSKGVITVGGQVCEVLVSAEDPALAPLCATAAEVANAIAQLLAEQASTKAATVGAPPPLTKRAIYTRVLANREKASTK